MPLLTNDTLALNTSTSPVNNKTNHPNSTQDSVISAQDGSFSAQNSAVVKIDLHSHSTCSDGTNSPTELINLAAKVGITTFALTDHDTLMGIEEAKHAALEYGITLISGVEISCQHTLMGGYGKNKAKDKVIHVLGLDFDDFDTMNAALSDIQASRATRGRAMTQKLAELVDQDFEQLWQSVVQKAGGNEEAVGRAHIAKVLFEKGVVKTMQQAFDKYLADNKPAYVAIKTLSMQAAIDLIHRCGGKAVLAHPTRYNLSATRVRKLIEEFAALGGDGCELPSKDEPRSKRQMIDRSIKTHDLSVSIGSDFHGSTMPWRKLGDVPVVNDDQRLVIYC